MRSLRRRPARFALTGAGAALGVAVLYAVLLTSAATTAALDDAVSGSAGDVDVFVGPGRVVTTPPSRPHSSTRWPPSTGSRRPSAR